MWFSPRRCGRSRSSSRSPCRSRSRDRDRRGCWRDDDRDRDERGRGRRDDPNYHEDRGGRRSNTRGRTRDRGQRDVDRNHCGDWGCHSGAQIETRHDSPASQHQSRSEVMAVRNSDARRDGPLPRHGEPLRRHDEPQYDEPSTSPDELRHKALYDSRTQQRRLPNSTAGAAPQLSSSQRTPSHQRFHFDFHL